jgi:nucleoside phosphorylase
MDQEKPRATRRSGAVTAVVAAMPEELAPLKERLALRSRLALRDQLARSRRLALRTGPAQQQRPLDRRLAALSLDVSWAEFEDVRLALAVTGDGAGNARDGIQQLLSALPIDQLIVIGVSGALSRELVTGSLLVAERVVDEQGRAFAAAPALVQHVARCTGAQAAVLVGAAQLADSAEEKARLLACANAGGQPAAVDLESAVFAEAAQRAGVPWLFLRSISDTAGENLPELLNACRDARGAVQRSAVLWRLCRSPAPLPALLRLRGRVQNCAAILARAIEALLAASQTAGAAGVSTVDG